MIPIARVCSAEVLVDGRQSQPVPFATRIPAVMRNEDIFVGPSSCRKRRELGPPRSGATPRTASCRRSRSGSTRIPPPWRWPPPPETSQPLSGIVKLTLFVNVENALPPPGTSKTGSGPVRLRTSTQIGFTGVSVSPVT